MNKLTIPTILVATVMVAGIFAFMPVQQASTVHTTLQTALEGAGGIDNTELNDALTIIDDFLDTEVAAILADTAEVLEIREIGVIDVDFNGAQSIRVTGALATDEFQLLSLSIVPGTGGVPVIAADEINIDGVTIDGIVIGDFTAIVDQDILTGIEYISTLLLETIPTGNVIVFDMTAGTAPPADGETISLTGKVLIRSGAADPVITTS